MALTAHSEEVVLEVIHRKHTDSKLHNGSLIVQSEIVVLKLQEVLLAGIVCVPQGWNLFSELLQMLH